MALQAVHNELKVDETGTGSARVYRAATVVLMFSMIASVSRGCGGGMLILRPSNINAASKGSPKLGSSTKLVIVAVAMFGEFIKFHMPFSRQALENTYLCPERVLRFTVVTSHTYTDVVGLLTMSISEKVAFAVVNAGKRANVAGGQLSEGADNC